MENIIFEQIEEVFTLKINRPTVLNALNRATLQQLLAFLQNPPSACKAIILTGEGEKSFIAGADIKEMNQMTPQDMLGFCLLGQQVANLLENGPYLTIAAVNGYAFGGGLEMALACDFIYASNNALVGLPEVKLGLIPGFGGTQRLSRRIGISLAKELILTGRKISAQEALNLHLLNKVCAENVLLNEALTTAKEILSHSFEAVMQAKHAINASSAFGAEVGMELERNACAVCFSSDARQKAMDAFLLRKI